ncbi:hypothetical protein CFP56_023349, partial [Quercus suber]
PFTARKAKEVSKSKDIASPEKVKLSSR